MNKKKFILMIDTETAMIDSEKGVYGCNSLVYDVGCAIVDRNGKVYETRNFVVDEVFHQEYKRMRTCYYNNKLPQYYVEIGKGYRQLATIDEIRKNLKALMKQYNCKTVGAFNTSFDYYALKATNKWINENWKFFPKDTKYIDVMKMAKDYLGKNKKYNKWCEKNNYLTPKGKAQMKAEIVYRYITKDTDFEEAHTGLCDVMIETEIMAWLNSKKVKLKREIEFKY